MNRLKEIKELKALAEELQLENREIIRKYKSGMSQTDRKRNSPNPTTASKPTATWWRKQITDGGIRSATSS